MRQQAVAVLSEKNGRLGEAISWSEESFNAFPIDEAYLIEDLLIALCRECGDSDQVETVAWQRSDRLAGSRGSLLRSA